MTFKPQPSPSAGYKSVHVRVSTELYDELEKACVQARTTKNGFVTQALRYALDSMEKDARDLVSEETYTDTGVEP